jgi:hypothetical protein
MGFMIMSDNGASPGEILKALSSEDFLALGLNHVAYLRPVASDENDSVVWSVHAADGTTLTVIDSRDIAEAIIRNNELHPVTVH